MTSPTATIPSRYSRVSAGQAKKSAARTPREVLPVPARRNKRLECEVGHVPLEAAQAGHDGGAPRPCRQDRQDHPGGRLRVGVDADTAVGLTAPYQVRQVTGEAVSGAPGRLGEAGIG